jgi:periplasmic protein TonB
VHRQTAGFAPPRPPRALARTEWERADDQEPAPAAADARERTAVSGDAAADPALAAAERAYLTALQEALAREQRYPPQARRRRQTGTATVSCVLQADGYLDEIRIAVSSGDPDLDQAALETLYRLRRFDPIPAALGRDRWPLRVPLIFNLR